MTWAKIFADFSGWTSAHGLPHIGRSTTTCLRVFWTIMFLVSAAIFGYQTYLLISRYIRFEVTVNTELKSEASAIKPETAPEMYEVLSVYQQMLMGNKSADPEDKFGFHRYDVTYPNDNGTERTNTTALVALQRRAREHLLLIGAQYNKDPNDPRMKAVTYPIEEVVESCSYGPQPPLPGVRDTGNSNKSGTDYGVGGKASDYVTCDRKDFKPTYDAAYGLCYTFNDPNDHDTPADNRKKPLTSAFAGPRYGLRLVLRSDQAEYLELTESAGMRIAVHEQEQEAFVDAFGYNAAAGFTTSFSIKYIHTTREGSPYGNCSKDGGNGDRYYTGNYSVEGCYRSCLQNEINKTCGCADPRYASPEGWTMCTYKQMPCLAQFSVGVEAAVEFQPSRQCNCPQICSESTYGVTVASATWPSQAFQVPNGKTFGLASKTRPECKPTVHSDFLGWRPIKNRELMKKCQEWYQQNTMNLEIYWVSVIILLFCRI